MKIAVFHNNLDNIGGAEFVALKIAEGLDADIYTTNIDNDKISKLGFNNLIKKGKIKSIGKVPLNSPFRQQSSFRKFRKLNLNKKNKKYDLFIIAGDWAMSAAVNNKPNIWYAHSPLNELWEFKNFVKKELLKKWQRPFYEIWVLINRKLTLNYSKHVNKWICNSKNTQKRIKKYYQKDAKVVNPPIEIKEFQNKKHKNYWLSVNRYARNKRIEMQLEAFKYLPNEKLIVVASYEKNAKQFEEYKNQIEKLKSKNVKILNWTSDEELKKLYSECKGFITTAKNEDFGMTPVEAMASGKPVIAPKEGGFKETIIDGKTGILINNITPKKIAESINKIESELKQNPNKYKNNCIKQAKKFDTKEFIRKIKQEIK